MTIIRTLIVDDEAPARDWLHTLCAKHADLQVVGQCTNASQAIQRLAAGGVDLVLLDVQLGSLTGFDVLQEVPALRAPLIIFVTAFDQHAVRAFDASAVDYLLKPVGEARFQKAMVRARKRLAVGAEMILYDQLRAALVPLQRALQVKSDGAMLPRIVAERDGAFHVIDVNLIEFIDVALHSNYVAIHIVGIELPYLKRDTLQSLGATLGGKQFLRIRRNCIVNLAHVARIERGADDFVVALKSEQRLPVGRSYRQEIADFVRTSGVGKTSFPLASARK